METRRSLLFFLHPPLDPRLQSLHPTKVVQLLVDSGSNVNPMEGGIVALHHAAQGGNVKVVRALLDAGANMLVQTASGDGAWSIAQQEGHQDILDLLNAALAEDLRVAMEKRDIKLIRDMIAVAGGQRNEPLLLAHARSFVVTISLQNAIKWYPLAELRAAIATAEASEAADSTVMDEARVRLAQLATKEFEAVMRKRQRETLEAAVNTAKEEGLVDEAVLGKARVLVSTLKAEPPGAEPAPAGTLPVDALEPPAHIDPALFVPFMPCADKSQVAVHGYEYWGGEKLPRPKSRPKSSP